jgi:ubiquinone biosynthesis protein COQ9
MTDNALEELLVSTEVQTARDRMEDYQAADAAAQTNPHGEQELEDLRQALLEMPGAVRMLIEAIDRAAISAGEPQYDPGDSTGGR